MRTTQRVRWSFSVAKRRGPAFLTSTGVGGSVHLVNSSSWAAPALGILLVTTVGCPLENAAFGSPCDTSDDCPADSQCVDSACVPDRFAEPSPGAPDADGGVEPDPSPAPSNAIVLSPPDDDADARFGESVALSGSTLVVGAPGIDHVFVYRLLGEGVDLLQIITPQSAVDAIGAEADIGPSAGFGEAVAVDGDVLVIGAPFGEWSGDPSPDMGQAFVCRRANAAADFLCNNQIGGQYSVDAAYFGTSVAIGRGGALGAMRIAVGEPGAKEGGTGNVREGAVSLWTLSAGGLLVPEATAYSPSPNPVGAPTGDFGRRVAFGPLGDRLAVAAPREDVEESMENYLGRVHVFTRSLALGPFASPAVVKPPAPEKLGAFGASVAFDSGGRLLVGQPNLVDEDGAFGAVFAFSPTLAGGPVEIRQDDANQHFGNGVAVVGSSVVVGAARTRSNTIDANAPTGVYGFDRDGEGYVGKALPALDGIELGTDDRLGYSVAADLNSIVSGAPGAQIDESRTGAVVVTGR